MGFFTWTLANKPVKYNRTGLLSQSCKLHYGTYGAVLCPDNTLIKEPSYDGCGRFDGKDVYELVVDWNREYLRKIVAKRLSEQTGLTDYRKKFNEVYAKLAAAYEDGDWNQCNHIADDFANTMQIPYFRKEWKRTLGIFIACENNANIPYPIKIVDIHYPVKPYDAYPPSINCQ